MRRERSGELVVDRRRTERDVAALGGRERFAVAPGCAPGRSRRTARAGSSLADQATTRDRPDGAAAAIVASERFVERHGLQDRAIEILGMAMATDFPSTFERQSMIKMVGSDMSRSAAEKAYDQSGVGPENLDVIELHDCFSCNELLTYEALGLCADGKGGELAASGATTYGGQVVVNPSGGLISKGHPLGATGIAQCAELGWQLRGEAEARQVEGAEIALQHNLGLGGDPLRSAHWWAEAARMAYEAQRRPFASRRSCGSLTVVAVAERGVGRPSERPPVEHVPGSPSLASRRTARAWLLDPGSSLQSGRIFDPARIRLDRFRVAP